MRRDGTKSESSALVIGLVLASVAAWIWALFAFAGRADLLAAAVLAYTLGLRHAFDADHIAAIDNVVRKLMAAGRPSAKVGFFFSLGHSTVVVLASAAVALAAGGWLRSWQVIGGTLGTMVSVGFLFAIGLANCLVLRTLWTTYARRRRGETAEGQEPGAMLEVGGPLGRLLRPLVGMISRAWHMYPLGLLFGLGFDTATEVALIGVAATQSAKGLPLWTVMVFPALFTAGMSLLDTLDSIVMTRAYAWALIDPLRRLRYNLAMTAISVFIAFSVCGLEALALVGDRGSLGGGFWRAVASVSDRFSLLGMAFAALLVLCWLAGSTIYRVRAGRPARS